MNLLVLLTNVLSLFNMIGNVSSLSVNSKYMNNYLDYIKQYGKEYNLTHYELFRDNVKKIEEHNNNNDTYKMEINMFTD